MDAPSQATNQFSVMGKAVYTHLKLENVTGSHKVRWEWYDPSGKIILCHRQYTRKSVKRRLLREMHRLAQADHFRGPALGNAGRMGTEGIL